MLKNDISHFYDVEPLMNIDSLVEVLLATIATKTTLYGVKDSNIIMTLPYYYKEIIQEIMYEENSWGVKFSKIIDIDKYYNKQSEWEKEFGAAIQKFLLKFNKKLEFDLENDYLEVSFTKNEINDILSKYDEETLEIVGHFANLIKNPNFNRVYKLESKEMNFSIKQRLYDHELFCKGYAMCKKANRKRR